MLVAREPFIIPTTFTWLMLFLVLGIFGFLAQVRSSVNSLLYPIIHSFVYQMLMTLGFRQEEAGRSAMGIYTQVSPHLGPCRDLVHSTSGGFRSCLGMDFLPDYSVHAVGNRYRDNHGLSYLRNGLAYFSSCSGPKLMRLP